MGYVLCDIMIPKFKQSAIKANLFGMDINKKGTPAGKVKMYNSIKYKYLFTKSRIAGNSTSGSFHND